MSARYALYVGRPRTARSDNTATISGAGCKRVFETDRIVGLVRNVRAVPLASGPGVLIGDVHHRRGPPTPVTEIDAQTEAALIDGKLDLLISSYWGSYVGAVDTPDGLIVFRDPSGTRACYFAETTDAVIFASDVRTLIEIGHFDPPIDWDGVTQYLYSSAMPSATTALGNISELLPGTSVKVHEKRRDIRSIWSPWDHASTRSMCSVAQNAAALHEITHNCVAALTHGMSRPLISVSGGLDSSIVAACIARSNKMPVGLTMFTDDRAGDERYYASILCEALGFELISCKYLVQDIAIDSPVSPHLPRPIGRTLASAYENALVQHAMQRHADGFATGNGGDNVFANLRSAKCIIDRLMAERWSGAIWSTFRDVAAVTGTSFWETGRAALKAYRQRADPYRWKPNTRFLHPDLIAHLADRPLEHEWLQGPDTALPGERVHIAGILRVQQTLEPPRITHAPVITPLIAQPVMELCLSIPTWQWCTGGRDRAVARLAFQADLPTEIIDRRVKGTPDSFTAQIITHYRDDIRDRLLDGELAQRGLLDRACLESVLSQDSIARAEDRPRLLDLLDTEAWISHWLGVAGTETGRSRSAALRSPSQ